MSGGYRKRRSSYSLEGDRKRYSFERCDYGSYIKQEYNAHVSDNGRQSYIAVPNNYIAPVASSFGIQNAAISNQPQRYYYSQLVNANESNKVNVVSSTRNYISRYNASYNEAISSKYDDRRRVNFECEVYINSLRQSQPRYVNFNDLQRHLSDIDIRLLYNWNFSTALDLAQELESSLKYFVDTRNELIFLRKLKHQECIPFSYNEINIQNRNGLFNRMRFLENESAYRSNRMNQLHHQLKSVVIPTIIDDIKYVHSVSYEKCWANRARYWFNLFKQIKWEKHSSALGDRARTNDKRSHRSERRNHKDEVDAANDENIKSEVIVKRKAYAFDGRCVKIEKNSNIQSKDKILQKQIPNPDESAESALSNIAEKTLASDGCNGNLTPDKNVEEEHQEVTVESEEKVDLEADKEIVPNYLSHSLILIEPNVSVVTVSDDDNHDSNINDNPPEGDTKN